MTDKENIEGVEASAQPVASDILAKAQAAADRLEAANKQALEILNRQEALRVQDTLSGKADVQISKPKEETPEEYAAKILNGDS